MVRVIQICLFFIAGLFLISACKNERKVDVSAIKLDIKVERFDKDFASISPRNLATQIPLLQERYDPFFSDYMQNMLSVGNTADTNYYSNLRTVINNPDYNALKAEVLKTFPDLGDTEKKLTQAFKHVKYYYPEKKIPKFISFLSGFAVQVPIGNNYVGIGLDMFLGADSKFYPALRQSIPLYISRKFTPENITPRVMETYTREELFPEPDNLKTFLDRMIYNGKILYFMDATMPEIADSSKIGYTSAQMEWCKGYEAGIWGFFLENNLLYETDYMKIQKYLTEAPFTPGIGEKNDSAPKLGIFSGWQVVKNYMDENKEVTLQELMADTDYQKILTRSRYKPK
ncbi:gliding motility lipoprotein GldB [Desertivirga arenae]|uniref:gliding motility lipoprotein GldB n=1 Tax=Desertivirga arenae TaxID=2810309 RepID=UPI001A963E49|nr:gliding motility lipoprotein GldB [Pedobacter sp. SYSU D00823]